MRNPKLILIIDDNSNSSTVASEMLQTEGFEVNTAKNGKEGLEIAMERTPDMVLLDIQMPVMNGYDTCKELRKDEKLKEVPVIFVSAMTEAFNKIKAYEVGGNDYVQKPYNIQELLMRVKTHLLVVDQREELRSINHILFAQLESTFEQAPVGIVHVEQRSRRFLKVNGQYAKMLGYTEKELLSMTIKDITDPDFHASDEKDIDQMIKKKSKVLSKENRYIRKDGKKIWVHVTAAIAHYSLDEIEDHFIAFVEDITTKKTAEEELLMAKDKAEESDRVKSAFIASMSHEIRTPLNAIVGFSELIARGNTETTLDSYAHLIRTQNDLLLQLVNDIIDYAKLEGGSKHVNAESFDLNQLLLDLFAIYKSRTANHVSMRVQAPEEGYIIKSDKQKIRQIYSNLITNSIKFTEKGEIVIGYSIDKVTSSINCYVKDTGIGIPVEKQHQIFERFTKLDEFSQGVGIGLSIVESLVDILSGTIRIDSDTGQGTTVNVNIPVEIIPVEADASRAADADIADAKRTKVLIVEDNTASFLYLKEIFLIEGIDFEHAKNGKLAVDYLDQYDDIDVVLMDMKMPVMSGAEASRIIRQKLPELPIIAVSAYALPSEQQMAIDAGCNSFVTKPVNMEYLLELIKKYVQN